MEVVINPDHRFAPGVPLSGRQIALGAKGSAQLGAEGGVRLICSVSGTISLMDGSQSHVLHAGQMLVLPAGTACGLTGRAAVAHVICLGETPAVTVPDYGVLAMSGLVWSLVQEAVALGTAYLDRMHRQAMLALLILEVNRSKPAGAAIAVSLPQDRRLMRVCRRLMAQPDTDATLDDWCLHAGMSRRSFTRAFKQQTGMTFGQWRREVRLLVALSRISAGEQVISAALEVGYDSVSAFTVAFSRRFGIPPRACKPGSHNHTLPPLGSGSNHARAHNGEEDSPCFTC
jgi:AraC-like DNA-binding protein